MKRYLKRYFGTFCAAAALVLTGSASLFADDAGVMPIGSDRQLFLDEEYLIDSLDSVEILVHHPVRREICDYRNREWEGCGSRFMTVLYDPEVKVYRMYSTVTRAEHQQPWDPKTIHVSYLESTDGIHWPYKPLNLLEYNGSTDNNLIIKGIMTFTPFIDTNPNCLPEERYKGVGTCGGGMSAWTSPDGIHWTAKNDRKYVYQPGTPNAFDSQNIGFWSEKEGQYVVYYRCWDDRGFRSVERAVSDDFINWKKEQKIEVPEFQLPRTNHGEFYTNNIMPYYRAPNIYLGFPARYNDNGITESFKYLPEQDERALRIKDGGQGGRFGTVTPDSVYFASRDGYNFHVSNDVFLAPGLRTKNNWSYGDNYFACGMVETQSPEEDEGVELSMYAAESSFTKDDEICRRYSLRIDGFASLHAKTKAGTAVLKPITFSGKTLSLNIATSGFGSAYVEICDADGNPIPGFTKDECDIIYGDSLDRPVSWKGLTDVSALAGKPVVLKFYLCESDIYSMKFEE